MEASLTAAELATSVLKYASEGLVQVRHVLAAREALVVELAVSGPGTADLRAALAEGFSRVQSLGVGFGAVHRMMDDVIVDTASGCGTRVIATKYVKR